MTSSEGTAGKNNPGQEAAQQQVTVEADDSQVVAGYANFCRVMTRPEELIVDFGLDTQAGPTPTHNIKLSQRVIMNYYTAKRLLGLLQMTIQRHEATFGVLETNIQKRVTQR